MATMIGSKLVVRFAKDTHGGREGVKAVERIGGRYSFPERRGPMPQDGEDWEVEVAGENPAGSVYFLRCLKRVFTEQERADTWQAQMRARERFQKVLQARLEEPDCRWTTSELTLEIEGESVLVRGQIVGLTEEESGVEIRLQPRVEYQGQTLTFRDVTVVAPWNEVRVERVLLDEQYYRRPAAEVVSPFGRHIIHFAAHAGEVTFLGWERQNQTLVAQISMALGDVEKEATIAVASFTVEGGRGQLAWAVNDHTRAKADTADHFLPEVPAEYREWLEELAVEFEGYGLRMKTAGLLTIRNTDPSFNIRGRVFGNLKTLLDEQGWGGLGWSPYGGGHVLNPALAPLLEGLGLELVPATVESGAPETAWAAITWKGGFEPPPAEEIERLRAETEEVEDPLDVQKFLAGYEGKPLPAMITCREEAGTDTTGHPTKYVFAATVQVPVRVRTYRKHHFGAFHLVRNRPMVSERVVERPHVFEDLPRGNEPFEGESTLAVWLGKRSTRYRVEWKAPRTAGELAESKAFTISQLIRVCRDFDVRQTGYRYTDSGNPVVYVGGLDRGGWYINEFLRDSFLVEKRKGSCSNKGHVWTISAETIRQGLEEYESYGWPVMADPDWKEKAGRPLLDIFPAELVARSEKGGGA